MPVAAAGRRADRDEDGVGAGHGFLEIVGEDEAPGAAIGVDDLVEARLEDRNLALLQARNLVQVLVDASDIDAELGKARARDQPDVTGSDHCDTHLNSRSGRSENTKKRHSHPAAHRRRE